MGDVVGTIGGTESGSEQRSRGPAVNEVRLLGRLTADPELRYTPNGHAVIEYRVATHERPEVEYHQISSFGRLATAIAEHLRKGALVFISGRLHSDSWTAADGGARRRVVVIGESVQFLTRGNSS